MKHSIAVFFYLGDPGDIRAVEEAQAKSKGWQREEGQGEAKGQV